METRRCVAPPATNRTRVRGRRPRLRDLAMCGPTGAARDPILGAAVDDRNVGKV
jgi:hypothetical protein